MVSLKEKALAWYFALAREADNSREWRLFQIWLHSAPENQQAFREVAEAQREQERLEAEIEPQPSVPIIADEAQSES